MKILKWVWVTIFLSSCVNVPVVPEAKDQKPVSIFSMSCKKPYEFKQDCSNWSGAARVVLIDEFKVKMMSTEDGTVIQFQDAGAFGLEMKDAINPLVLNSPSMSRGANTVFLRMKEYLAKANIGIKTVIPVTGAGDTYGYILELEGDGYSYFKQYTMPEKQADKE